MRPLLLSAIYLLLLFFAESCKPKDKSSFNKMMKATDSSKSEQTESDPQKILSARELIINKWQIKEAVPAPQSDEDKKEMLSTIIEFTRDGNIFVTSQGERKVEAGYTLSMDEKYLFSREINKDDIDTIMIQRITPRQLVLQSKKDNTTLVLEPVL